MDLCTYRSATCRLYVRYWHQVTWNLLKKDSIRQASSMHSRITLFETVEKFYGSTNNELTMHRAMVFNQHLPALLSS